MLFNSSYFSILNSLVESPQEMFFQAVNIAAVVVTGARVRSENLAGLKANLREFASMVHEEVSKHG